jgi:hypothetical protein
LTSDPAINTICAVLQSKHIEFPAAGIELHVSAEEALVSGIKPGDPAVVEATVRPFTIQEYLAEGLERTFATEEEEIEFFGRCPVPGEVAAPATEAPAGGEAADDYPTIRWGAGESAAPVAESAAPAVPAGDPAAGEAADADDYPTIRWRSAAMVG